MRGRIKGLLGRTFPVADAAEALVNGIEGRVRHVVYPAWVRPLIALRWAAQRVTELDVRQHVSGDDALALEEVRRQGWAASQAVGAGGAADRAARASR